MLLEVAPRTARGPVAETAGSGEATHHRHERADVAGSEQETADAISYGFGQRSEIAGDDRQTDGEPFERCDGQTLVRQRGKTTIPGGPARSLAQTPMLERR
jgi:hypothetical protein